ncbi:hypothetical protein BL250_11250 [Erwinia sp. OLTSP20]|uniref:YdgH/BhsA/McbA-like domain containing protein n=1 Tax=unclassified Erwinia TaxID=2622719 RepID=UPI000C182190|nr:MULTISPECIES: YdgH/BhsA/McbA-like domain containing protein [unclassified Erwinia]PIJ51070.1 hypothetical protein BV501_06110 [Erwinia sp. OAMSP11]PIJ73662.1 hypothetical protein BK416_05990 [Erwinia sp. OLSSP12]PIJ83019.1 hypothetical protein BLD47_05485 [Erwinia sp. OLCASP19]PIJ85618.1 hypothetical protein BLD46_05515 [Erwinia sp. OLMTSP26]PIJ87733.1 hypothetical protein BLD49_05600 [Erwinia sp. OLMDSP33]
MKTKLTMTLAGLACALTFGVSAAQLVTSDVARQQNLQPVGVISVSGLDSSPMTIRQNLSRKADTQGASKYRVIEAYTNGNYHATAEIYK